MNSIKFKATEDASVFNKGCEITLNGLPIEMLTAFKVEFDCASGPNSGKVLVTLSMFANVDIETLAGTICPKFIHAHDGMDYDLVPTSDPVGWRHRLKCILWWNPIFIPWLSIKRRIIKAVRP